MSDPLSTPCGAALIVRDLDVALGGHPILRSLSLAVEAGRTLAILGESGCGKTTLLRAIAGVVQAERGRIMLDERDITALSTAQRGVVYLDQEPLLFEHLTVAENLAFSLQLRGVGREQIAREVDAMLRAIDLSAHGRKREWQLSGGQKQRVAFGRAVLAAPRLLLLDEPFGSLDGKTRTQMQLLFARIVRQRCLTSLFVTHDVKESLLVADQFSRMEGGELQTYVDRQSYLRDPATGIPEEMEFWRAQEAEGRVQ